MRVLISGLGDNKIELTDDELEAARNNPQLYNPAFDVVHNAPFGVGAVTIVAALLAKIQAVQYG